MSNPDNLGENNSFLDEMADLAAKHRAEAIDKQCLDMLAEFNLTPKTMRLKGYVTLFETVDGQPMMTVAKVLASRPMPKTEIVDGRIRTVHYIRHEKES